MKEETKSQKLGTEMQMEMETYGLYDKVKLDIYEDWEKANEDLRDIEEKDLPSGLKEIKFMYHGRRFVSRIMSLYRRLKNKLEYIRDADNKATFIKLYELDEYELKGKNTADMTFLQAKEYFDLETKMLEKLGITKFEIEKLPGSSKLEKEEVEE